MALTLEVILTLKHSPFERSQVHARSVQCNSATSFCPSFSLFFFFLFMYLSFWPWRELQYLIVLDVLTPLFNSAYNSLLAESCEVCPWSCITQALVNDYLSQGFPEAEPTGYIQVNEKDTYYERLAQTITKVAKSHTTYHLQPREPRKADDSFSPNLKTWEPG